MRYPVAPSRTDLPLPQVMRLRGVSAKRGSAPVVRRPHGCFEGCVEYIVSPPKRRTSAWGEIGVS